MEEAIRLADDGGMKYTCLLLTLFLAGCAKEAHSDIVQRVQDAGAGDVRSVSQQSLEQWFRQHPAVGDDIKGLCGSAQQNAAASWGDSTEGRVCKASTVAAAFRFVPRKGDGRGFEAGK